jgi:hypothetical protein
MWCGFDRRAYSLAERNPMGDKSPKSKEKSKKQSAADKTQKVASAANKAKTAVAAKGK